MADPLLPLYAKLFRKIPLPTGLQLRLYSLKHVPWSVLFNLVFLSYFVVLAGVVYDMIVEPPSMGYEKDPATGRLRPSAIIPGRMNAQYVMEGFSASMLISLGGLGFILVDLANRKVVTSKIAKNVLIVVGISFAVVSYQVLMQFLKIKIPAYGFFYQ